ncbi:MAG: hypothetical protein CLLPBCKN_001086 [Chroococcidiopsis cubana SAG 39.79]|uniref:Cytochrome c domain-containing protein n=1 Tax=Chroococcidiopsis cubana SAG 39.79 TaxID=388085 RepID=A0AB37UN68_9CYAN|nr:di-heme oxidoredictase family protein [Chroococcidiopsis cubana]MDZ4871698.1 hypothetical protein [Chroococcidiopsis cubana SAG 39.79]PSB62842.1 hypothetical protein C7B79_16350 [Chroococcidiopsis cubana CCALA 043]RUT12888.1 hypothetical protein DSM107010_17330 [Chroococcidiopsis cubana SAG 39.79]
MRWRKRFSLFGLLLVVSLTAVLLSTNLLAPKLTLATEALLQPAPTQPLGYYDYFGKLLTPQAAEKLVRQKGLDPSAPGAFERIGAVQITQQLIEAGDDIFLNRKVGDTLGIQGVLGFGTGLARIQPELIAAIRKLGGRPTTNLQLTLQQDLKLGSHFYAKGSTLDTGLDVLLGATFPIGLKPDGNFTCAVCHDVTSQLGDRLKGVPNGDLNVRFLIALAPNSTAGFARLDLDPLDPKYQGNGKAIVDSRGNLVTLPDPQKFEDAFDDTLLDVPFGHFESSPDGINNTTQIPSVFTFKSGPYFFDGQFAIGPFAGLSATGNGVHSSEGNLLAAAQLSTETLGLDPEVYLGVVLQNAADPRLRLPEGVRVKPSEWLRQVAPDPRQAELEDQIPAPGAGTYPNLRPSLFTYNGAIFSPDSFVQDDIASGPFLFADNAMAAFQNSLVPPPNRTQENITALKNGSVRRGAQVFQRANCATCHAPPFFTDNKIHPLKQLGNNSARARSRLALKDVLVPPKIYTLNNPVPIPANAEVLDVPTEGISDSPTTLPKGFLPDGGYKTLSLRGVYLSAPYLHDGGVAVRAGSLKIQSNGSFTVVDRTGLGLTGTLSIGQSADSASSLRALLDRQLRSQVIAANQANPALVRSNLDGTGHEFYVDKTTGFTPAQQTDLINFLLALDDDPGRF